MVELQRIRNKMLADLTQHTDLAQAMEISLTCPQCKKDESIHCFVGQESDGDENGTWIDIAVEIRGQDCVCNLPDLELMDELREDGRQVYDDLY